MVPARDRATDFADARFTIRAVIGIVVFTVSMIGSQWAFSASLQTAIAKLDSRMDAKDTIDARDRIAVEKERAAEKAIAEQWRTSMEKKVDQIERDYKLNDYDIKALITTKR